MSLDRQGDLFANLEGDRWFERNRGALDRWEPATDTPMHLLARVQPAPATVLEIGAANGYRVAAIVAATGCRGVAVEPSAEAIADGRHRYPNVEFHQGRIDSVAVDEAFDFVIVNFVLHWVDRSRLLPAVAEIDRLVASEGHLVIGDFLPATPTRTKYHHLPDGQAFTYKQDYPALFTASGLYEVVVSLTGSHSAGVPAEDVPDEDRVGFALLYKPRGGVYATGDIGDGAS